MQINNYIIPLDVAFIIIGDFRPYELNKIAIVCKNWNAVAFHNRIWARILTKHKLTHLSKSEYMPLFLLYERERVITDIEQKLRHLIQDNTSKELYFRYHSWSQPDATITAMITTKNRTVDPSHFKKKLTVRGDEEVDYYCPKNKADFFACHKVVKELGIERVYSVFITVFNIDKAFSNKISKILFTSV